MNTGLGPPPPYIALFNSWASEFMLKIKDSALHMREKLKYICETRLKPLLELGYLFQTAHWGKGYAAEAAAACRDYAFTVLHEAAVHSMIRNTHTASQNVAKRIGMQPVDSEEKNFRNTDMVFVLYRTEKTDADLSLHA